MDLRLHFIVEHLSQQFSRTVLAAAYGISRKTAYYWVRQYERHGPGRLAGTSRRPRLEVITSAAYGIRRRRDIG